MSQSPILDSGQSPAFLLDDDDLYEVVNGERRETEPMGLREVALASMLMGFFQDHLRKKRSGIAFSEGLFVLDAEKGLQRRPDVAFVSFERWPESELPSDNAWSVVPDLAVEVVSPSNRASAIEAKVTEYFAAGVRSVWVLYPGPGRVYVYRTPTEVQIFDRSGELDGGEVLPGFRLKIEDLFAAVRKPE